MRISNGSQSRDTSSDFTYMITIRVGFKYELTMKRTLSKNRDIDLDPLSTSVVEDLLASAAEWKGVSDIVRLTLKAVTDVIRVQAASIKEINNMLPTRASKTELTTGLSLKANINDVSRTIS